MLLKGKEGMLIKAGNIPKFLRIFWRMYWKKPTFVSFNVTNRCNERCPMCSLWRTTSEELTLEEIERILMDLKNFGIQLVEISGGEPFLRTDILDIFALLDRIGLLYTITTNGTVLTGGHIKGLQRARKALQIAISLDSLDQDRYARLRGQDLHATVLENITRLAEAQLPMPVKLNFTMSRVNYEETFAMLDYARAKGISLSVFPINMGEGFLHRHADPMFTPDETERYEMAEIFRGLARLRRKGEPLWEYSRFYELSADYVLGRSIGRCDAGDLYLDLHADGILAPCIEHKGFADLRKEKIREAWDRIRAQKEMIRECDRTNPCCYTCTFNISITARHLLDFTLETAKIQGLLIKRGGRPRLGKGLK